MSDSVESVPISIVNNPVAETGKKISAPANYIVFGQLIRDQFVQSYPNRSLKVAKKLISILWRELTADEKSMFIQSNITSPTCLDLAKRLVYDADVSSLMDYSDAVGEVAEPAQAREDNEPADELYWSAELGLVVVSLRYATLSSEISSTEGEISTPQDRDMRVVPIDCTANTYEEIIVKMSSLSLFESALIPRLTDSDTADFTVALRFFADWDDCDRDSYEWMGTCSSEFGAMSLVLDPAKGKAWRERVWGDCPECIQRLLGGRSKLYLFFLIADRCFSTEEAWELVWKLEKHLDTMSGGDEDFKLTEVCMEVTDTEAQLLHIISMIRAQVLDVEDKQFRRSASRIGGLYQADIEPFEFLDTRDCSANEKAGGIVQRHKALNPQDGDGLVYTPTHGLDEAVMSKYLQRGREKIPIRQGLLVTAMKSAVGATLPSSVMPPADGAARLSRYRVCMVEKCSIEEVPVVQCTSLTSIPPAPLRPPVQTASDRQIPSAAHHTADTISSCAPLVASHTIETSSGVATPCDSLPVDLLVSEDCNDGSNSSALNVMSSTKELESSMTAQSTPENMVRYAIIESKDSASNDESTTPTQLNRATSVVTTTTLVPTAFVHDSTETYAIPTTLCHPRPSWEECLLHVLHKHDYDVEKSLAALVTYIETMSMEVRMAQSWDEQTISMLFRVARATNMDVLELYKSLRASLASSNSRLISMKDIMYICGEIFTATASGLTDDWFFSPGVTLSKRSQRRTRGVLAPPGSRISYTQVRDGIPNRWPSSITFVRHNLLWMRLSNLPCVILSLDLSRDHTADPALIVFPICSSMLRRAQSVSPNSLSSFDGENMSLGNVEKRTVDFALAMRDFADRELRMYPQCKWYVYPSFIMDLLASHNDFRAWRSKVERSSRGRSADNRKIYLDALLEQHEQLKDQDERCLSGGGYPWDDSIIVPPTPPPSPPRPAITPCDRSGSGAETAKKGVSASIVPSWTANTLSAAKENKRFAMKVYDSLITATSPPEATTSGDGTGTVKAYKSRDKKEKAPPPPRKVVMSNLFWVAKIGLPCIFYDEPGREHEDKFHVLPISTVTAKYDTLVSVKEVRELSVANVKNCNEERSRDLGEALLMLYQWQAGRTTKALLNEGSVTVQTDDGAVWHEGIMSTATAVKEESDTTEPFQWPDFVLDLVAHTSTWRTWSSGVERNMVRTGKSNVRVQAYFSRLKEQFLDVLREKMTAEEAADTAAATATAEKIARSNCVIPKLEIGGAEIAKKRKRRTKKAIAAAAAISGSVSSSLSVNTSDLPEHEAQAPAPPPINMSNIFWIPKLQLPGIFYDEEGYEKNESFCVFPLSITSPRCYESMKASTLRPLTFDNIANCIDIRTRSFGEALIKFYEWAHELELEEDSDDDNATVSPPEQKPFAWPDFILDLVAHKDEWKSWKRETERNSKKMHIGSAAQSSVIADVYFEALQEQYCDIIGIPTPPPHLSPPKLKASVKVAKVISGSSTSSSASVPHNLAKTNDIEITTNSVQYILHNSGIATVSGEVDKQGIEYKKDVIEASKLRSGSMSSQYSWDTESSSRSIAEVYSLNEEIKRHSPSSESIQIGSMADAGSAHEVSASGSDSESAFDGDVDEMNSRLMMKRPVCDVWIGDGKGNLQGGEICDEQKRDSVEVKRARLVDSTCLDEVVSAADLD